MSKADIIMYLVDAQSGVTPLDQTVAEMLRRSGAGKKVLVVATKVDSRSWEAPFATLRNNKFLRLLGIQRRSNHGNL